MQGRSESQWRVIAHRRSGRKARLARGGIREHDAFLGHEMKDPAGTGRGGVSMAGGQKTQGTRKGNGLRGLHLPSPPCFILEFAYLFQLSVSIRKVASEHPSSVFIYMNSYIFHIYFIYLFSCQIHI